MNQEKQRVPFTLDRMVMDVTASKARRKGKSFDSVVEKTLRQALWLVDENRTRGDLRCNKIEGD